MNEICETDTNQKTELESEKLNCTWLKWPFRELNRYGTKWMGLNEEIRDIFENGTKCD